MPGAVLCGGDRAGTGEREDRHRGVGTGARGAAAGGGCGAGNRRRGDGGRPNGGHPRIALQLIRPLNTQGGVWPPNSHLRFSVVSRSLPGLHVALGERCTTAGWTPCKSWTRVPSARRAVTQPSRRRMAAESRGFDSALEKCALFYREGRRANVPDHSGACTDGELLPGVYVSFNRAQGDDLGGQHVSAHPAGHPDGQPVCRNLEVALDLPVHEDVLLTGQPAPNRHGLADESRVGGGRIGNHDLLPSRLRRFLNCRLGGLADIVKLQPANAAVVQLHVRYEEPPYHIGGRSIEAIDGVALGTTLQPFASTTRAADQASWTEDRRGAHATKMVLYRDFRLWRPAARSHPC